MFFYGFKKIFKYPLNKEPTWPTNLNYFKAGESRERITQLVESAIKEGKSYEAELEVIDSEGREMWVLIHGEAERKNERCVRIFGSLQNIDTRKRIELENSKIALHNEILASLTANDLILSGQLSQSKQVITESICHALNIEQASIWFFNSSKTSLSPIAAHNIENRMGNNNGDSKRPYS